MSLGPLWKKKDYSVSPGSRLVHEMEFDAKNKNIVLFGGRLFSGGKSSETWIWEKDQWEEMTVEGPMARDGHSLTFCENGSNVVLFGGSGNGELFNDTWIWNGRKWMSKDVSGPEKRWGHAAVSFDGKILLFGGKGDDKFWGDTWEWNGSEWKQVSQTGPLPRYGPRMGTYKGKVILYGGRDHSGNWFRDTWEWDGGSWRELIQPESERPGTSAAHFMVTSDTDILLIGGILKGTSFPETWSWNGENWIREEDKLPFQLDFGASAYDKNRAEIIITGNSGSASKMETWVRKSN